MESKLVSITIGGEVIDIDDDGKVVAKNMLEPKEVMPEEVVAELGKIIMFVEERSRSLNAAKPNRAVRRQRRRTREG